MMAPLGLMRSLTAYPFYRVNHRRPQEDKEIQQFDPYCAPHRDRAVCEKVMVHPDNPDEPKSQPCGNADFYDQFLVDHTGIQHQGAATPHECPSSAIPPG
jgi:hypothetical protein